MYHASQKIQCTLLSPAAIFHYLEAVVGPATELHDAGLLVEREILDVHLTGRMINGRRFPLNQSGVEQGGLRGQRHFKVTISTERKSALISNPFIITHWTQYSEGDYATSSGKFCRGVK